MKRPVLLVTLLILVMVCTAAALFFYFQPNNNVVTVFKEGELNLVIEGEQILSQNPPKVVDEEILLPLDIIKKYLDPNIYWDDKLKKVTVTTKDRVIRMKTDSLDALINNKPVTLKIPVTVENGVTYIPIEFLKDVYNVGITYLKDTGVIIIDNKNSIKQVAEPVSPAAVVRSGRSIHYPIVSKPDVAASKPGDKSLRVFEEYEKWYKVRTTGGIIGYIEKKFVAVKSMPAEVPPVEESAKPWKPGKGKINLVWEAMYEKMPDLSGVKKIEGLDVVSPTWFQVANPEGTLINRVKPKYIEWAHKNGYQVWALLSNDFGSTSMTQKLLNNTDARDNVIRQVLVFTSLYKLDGINIDFENVDKEDRDALTQFVREAAPLLREQGLVVSIDVTVPDGSDNWSRCYDRKALGEAVDYVMLMAYDQHWSTSPEAGSVAQAAWVESNLKKTLEMIPADKLLLGVPFYTRLWKEEPGEKGGVKVSSQAMSMEAARKLIRENNAPVQWDEVSGQFYAQYKKDNITYKIWLEDENSINIKSSLTQKYKLAGAAGWKRGNEVPAVWDALNRNLKTLNNYQEWLLENKGKKYVLAP